jgi:hypothetical protein
LLAIEVNDIKNMASIVGNEQVTRSSLLTTKKSTPSIKPRVKFDEEGIAVDYAERGVLYGTQTIDQVETPYIYYDSDEDPIVHLNKATSEEIGVPQRMEAAQLQEKLGLLQSQQESASNKTTTTSVTATTSSTASTTSTTSTTIIRLIKMMMAINISKQ